MAEQKIRFSIGTDYNGEGMLRAKNGIIQLNRSTNMAAEAVSKFATSFGGIDAKCATAARAITSVMNAFVSLNPIMLGVTAATAAFTWGIQQCNKKQEEAKARADALRQSLVKLWDEGYNPKFLKNVANEIKSISAEFDRTTKLANTLQAAMARLSGSKGANEIATIELEKANASFAALDDAQRQISDAYYDSVIAQKKLDQAKAAQAEAIDAATKAVTDAESRLQISRDAISKMNDELEKLNAQYESIYGNEEAEKDIKKRIIETEKAIADAKVEEQARLNDLRVAMANEQTARVNSTTAIVNAERAVTASIQKQYAVEEALEKRRKAEEEAAETARQNKDADERALQYKQREEELTNDLNEMLSKDIKTQEGLNAAKEKMSEVLDKYANDMGDGAVFKKVQDALARLGQKIDNLNVDGGRGGGGNGGGGGGAGGGNPFQDALRLYAPYLNNNMNLIDTALGQMPKNNWSNSMNLQNPKVTIGGVTKPAQEWAAENAVKQGIENGSIRNSRDAARAGRDAARAYRDAASSPEANQARRDAQNLERLSKKNPKAMSPTDKKELERLKQLDKARKNREDEANAEAKKQQEMEQGIKDITNIYKMLQEKLGLK